MPAPDAHDGLVVVPCRVCGTRVDEIAEHHPKQVPCPDCLTMLTVPSRAQVLEERKQKAAKSPPTKKGSQPDDIYRLVLTPVEPSPAPTPVIREPDVVLVVCPICRARLHLESREEAGHVQCPDCFELVRVPARAEVEEQRRQQAVPVRPAEPVEGLFVPQPVKRRRLRTEFHRAQATIRREAEDPPPRWTFFSRVFEFPWTEGVLGRWIWLSLGLLAISLVNEAIRYILENAQGYMMGAFAFFALPLMWIVIWTYSYAGSIWISILEDTAGGNDRIHHWLQQNWREWVIESCRFAFLLALACGVGHGVGMIVALSGGADFPARFLATLIVFPIVVLSALHAGSVYVPLTLTVLKSLVTSWQAWLQYYLLATLLIGGFGMVWLMGLESIPLSTAIFSPFIWSAIWLIWARLLGRLGWAISQSSLWDAGDELPQDEASERPRRDKSSKPA